MTNKRTGEYSYQHGRAPAAHVEYSVSQDFDLDEHGHIIAPNFVTDRQRLVGDSTRATMGDRIPEAFGVQAWSQGPIYPCVIAVVERYETFPDYREWIQRPGDSSLNITSGAYVAQREAFYAQPVEARLRSRSFELTLDGRSEEYASREDAEQVARALLVSSAVRYQWSRGEL